jgi:hypothetical protein
MCAVLLFLAVLGVILLLVYVVIKINEHGKCVLTPAKRMTRYYESQ